MGFEYFLIRPKKSPVSGQRSVFWCVFLPTGKYVIHVYAGTKFPIMPTQSMVAKRGPTNWANVHTPVLKICLKHSPA